MGNRFIVNGCAFVLIIGLLCGGCHATPEKEIVAGKDAEELESVIHESNMSTESSECIGDENENESFVYKDEFNSSDGRVKIKVNAKVFPLTEQIPVYRVAPRTIEVEDVQKWADYFFQGQTAYDQVVELSKSEIEQKILDLKRESDPESLMEEYGTDPEVLAPIYEYYKEHIAYYEELYKMAPEEVVRKETTWEFRPSTYYSVDPVLADENEKGLKTMKLKIETEIDDLTYEIWATNRDESDYMLHKMWFVSPDEAYERGELSITEEKAIQLVDKVLKDLGMDKDWKICSSGSLERDNRESYYYIQCRRYYDGVPVAVFPQLDVISGEGEYAARYFYESLEFHVSNGKVCLVYWESPLEVTAVENENVKVLSWEEVLERFQDQMEVQFTAYGIYGEEIEGDVSYYISRVEQSLVRIKIPDTEGEFYLVPAWNFYGSVNGNHPEAEGGVSYAEPPVLTLNAIDGTVINTSSGY